MFFRALIPLALIALPISTRVDPLSVMTFALIPAGSFDMGTPAYEPQREGQERLHRVTLTRAFYLAVHEVTQRQWTKVMGRAADRGGSRPTARAAGCATRTARRIAASASASAWRTTGNDLL